MAQILIVDDSETIRKLADMTLSAAGHSVAHACDGEEGLSKFQTGSFDLVISDINMPKKNGIELVKAIRALNSEIPILVLTTESEDAMRKKGAEAGADGWIVKPFKPAQFVDIVKQILES